MFAPKLRLDPELMKRAQEKAKVLGYSSLEEYVTHLLEREMGEAATDPAEDKAVLNRLKGLGYL